MEIHEVIAIMLALLGFLVLRTTASQSSSLLLVERKQAKTPLRWSQCKRIGACHVISWLAHEKIERSMATSARLMDADQTIKENRKRERGTLVVCPDYAL